MNDYWVPESHKADILYIKWLHIYARDCEDQQRLNDLESSERSEMTEAVDRRKKANKRDLALLEYVRRRLQRDESNENADVCNWSKKQRMNLPVSHEL